MWPGNPDRAQEYSDISNHRAHELGAEINRDLFEEVHGCFPKSHLKNQSVDCSHIPSASRTQKEKYARVGEESLRVGVKEGENETAGNGATGVGGVNREVGETGRGRVRGKGEGGNGLC